METSGKFHLTEEKETLFITLYAKALDYRSRHSVLHDKTANEIVKKVNLDLTKYKGFGNSVVVIRARQFDEWIKEFINKNKNAVVVYVGCGLDTRITRINPPSTVTWFDVDYPEVIRLRKKFYSNREGYEMIESSVTETGWLEQIPNNRPTLIVAEGLLEYLTAKEVKTFLQELTNYFKQGEMIFDVMNSFAIKSGKEKLKNTTGAVHKWAVDDVKEVDNLNASLKRITTLSVFETSCKQQLPFGIRLPLSVLSLIPQIKNMMRLMRYQF